MEQHNNSGQERSYLDTHNSYYAECYAVVPPQKHWIEVPEGAEVCVEITDDEEPTVHLFYKNNGTIVFDNEKKEWFECGKPISDGDDEVIYFKQAAYNRIVWRRKHPEELPFIDDEPQECAEKLSGTSTAWSTQVGGDHYKHYKIQPMEFALANNLDAAQANVIKYVMRHKDKKGLEDLQKAKHYIDLMIAHYYGGGV